MTPKRKNRMIIVILLVVGVAIAAGLALVALNKNINLFYSPSQIVNGEAPTNHNFRIGGMVAKDSVKRAKESLLVSFDLHDGANHVTVEYEGILPDLFREEQGIVAQGQLVGKTFKATEVLAKHDENYMPPEVEEAMAKAKALGVNKPAMETK